MTHVCLLALCLCCPESVREKVFVIRRVWKLAITVYIVFFVTLMVFPGISSEVQYCTVGDWMPIILIATFNLSDCVSRVRDLSWAYRLEREREHSFVLVVETSARLMTQIISPMAACRNHSYITILF